MDVFLNWSVDRTIDRLTTLQTQAQLYHFIHGTGYGKPKYDFIKCCNALARAYRLQRHHAVATAFTVHMTDSNWLREEADMKFDGKWAAVTYRLTERDKEPFNKWTTENQLNVEQMLEGIGARGYKFSASYIFDSNSWCFTVTTTDNVTHTKNSFMTSWSETLTEAVEMACYKLFVIWQDKAWVGQAQTGYWG